MHELEDPRATTRFICDVTASKLEAGTDVDSCRSLVAKADARFEMTFAHLKQQGAAIACKAGCSFCCHLRVSVAPHEAIALFRHLQSEIPASLAGEIEQRILENADHIARMSEQQHLSTNVKCAFLVNGSCSAYRVRPMACALHHSLDVNACERLFENPADHSIGIRRLKVIEQMRGATKAGLSQALDKLGLSGEAVELHTAVAAILRDRSLISRWRSGRSLLKSAP